MSKILNSIAGGGVFNTYTPTLTTSAWSPNTQTVSAPGLRADTMIMIAPHSSVSRAAFDDFFDSGVRAVSQNTNQVTFECDPSHVPSNPIQLIIVEVVS